MKGVRAFQIGEVADSQGEDALKTILDSFDCRYNAEVNDFLKTKALDFTRRKVSITHLLFDEQTRDLLGYFTLAHKPLAISCASMSATQRKRVERFSDFDASLGFVRFSSRVSKTDGCTYEQLLYFIH